MKLKKLMALGVAAVMTLSLTACGGKSDTPSNSSSATDNNASADKSTTGNDASAPDTDTQIQPEGIPTIDQIKVGGTMRISQHPLKCLRTELILLIRFMRVMHNSLWRFIPISLLSMKQLRIMRRP